ncbi:hypothetical protein [Bradyrhizobium sp. AUGA SZCCT0182]|uniref:hypothetical protein n=1 Tax=Bradyrhizobium sp. AUGA SZCCT0182 TaxID=2807667 RepID=UPI001BAC58FA|nr:hypothetical protein [Bradyrhizobium sp. AUGA SZCCT0182]MBR1233656.1 hypothetical protein [Bradyrhizobium sp. AUGA SZCCT0182]
MSFYAVVLSESKIVSDVQEFNRLAVGARFKISELGATRLRSLAGKTGIVVEVFRSNTGVTVLFDGAKRPTCLHRDFITPISRNASASAATPGRKTRQDSSAGNELLA